MKQEIIDNHLGVSATSVSFLEYAIKQGGCLNKLNLLDDDLPPMLRDYKYQLHSWPWFISPKTKCMLEDCVRHVPNLVSRAVLIEFGKDIKRFCDFYDMPEIIGELVLGGALKTRYVSQRTDAILTEKGFKIVELNLGFRIGGWQIQWMDHQYRKQVELKQFIEDLGCHSRDIPQGYMNFLVRSIRERNMMTDGKVNVVFVNEFAGMDGPSMIGSLYEQALRDQGCEGRIYFTSELSELVFTDRGVFVEGDRMGAVISSHGPPSVQLFRACLADQILWSDSPIEKVLADKRSLALLYKHRTHHSFSNGDRLRIETYLPWAAPLRAGQVVFEGRTEDLSSLLLRLKDRFVVKVARGGQGNDVFVGRHQSFQDWVRLITRGLSEGNWLVQEFCRSMPFYGQLGDNGYGTFDVVWGVYGFGDEYSGCWLRLMECDAGKGVINSDKGAEETIVYEVAS